MSKWQIYTTVQRVWDVDGFPNHFFDELGQLYRITQRGELKLVKRTIKRYTQGYVIRSHFYSLHQLRPMLRRHDPAIDRPVGF